MMTSGEDNERQRESAVLGYAAVAGGLVLLGGLAGWLLRGPRDNRISDKTRRAILERIGKEGHHE